MALTHGARLGPYEIDALIGAGGMGEVYRATDTRLRRTVAIKTISDRLHDRQDLRERFRIEAEAIAALAHPHICQIHDIGEQDGLDFLVMEFLEGEPLAARLPRGPLPLAEALRIAGAIADALDAAHRRGIVHRDLKPANVMLTRTGVKLLDFGLARWRGPDGTGATAGSTLAPTMSPLTEAGARLGTWPYMAPEQIRGEPADARSDIFALGAVLYEMVAGRRPFDASSHHALVTAILEQEPPPLSAANPACPPPVERLVRLCLEKDPDRRWQSAGDIRRALETIAITPAHHSVSATAPSLARRARSLRRLAWGTVAALALFVVAGVAWLVSRPQSQNPARLVRSTIAVDAESAVIGFGEVAFAPDGQSIVYTGRAGTGQQLYRRLLRETKAVPLAGTEGASGPFFSPDGQWVGFFNDPNGKLMKVPAAGGLPAIICDIQAAHGASWGEDGTIVVGLGPESGLGRVPASGGTPQPLTTLAPEDEGNDHRWPQVLPGGRSALSSVGTGPEEDARIVVHDLRTNARKELLRGSASARYVPTGHLVYARGAELMAMPFDLDRLEVTGSAVRIAEGVAEENDGAPEYSFSSAGDLVYVPGHSGGPRRRLVFVNLQGQVDPIDLPPSVFSAPRVSPDGQQIAVMVQGAKNNTWIYDVTRGAFTRVTFGRYQFPVWTPDGRLTLGRGGPGKTHLVVRAADGAGGDETLTPLARDGDLPGSWSPDGPTLVFLRSSPAGDSDLWTLTPGQDPAPFLSTRYNENNGRYSPDGRLMAYASDETGRFEIYLRDIPGDTRRQVSTTGAANAVWSRDGRRLYYRSPPFPAVQGTLWAVDVDTRPALAVTKPRQLFPTAGFGQYFDIMPDGQRFVMVQLDATPPPKQLNLVLNWFQQPASAESR